MQSVIDKMNKNDAIAAEAAKSIEDMIKTIDGMNGDHYTDYLAFYFEKYLELLEQRDKLIGYLKKETEDLCKYCKHKSLYCNGEPCELATLRSESSDGETKVRVYEYSCMEEDFGSCAKLKNSPCAKCMIDDSGFEWDGE